MLLIDRKITEELYDIAILGGGVAGLAAAMTSGQTGLQVLVLEKAVFGGSVAVLESVTDYPGIEKIGGWELTQAMMRQAKKAGGVLLDSIEVSGVRKTGNNIFAITCSDGNRFRSRSILVTTGGRPRLLGLEDERRFVQRGIHTCAQCAGSRYAGREVAVAGNGPWAVEAAMHLLDLGCGVYFITGDEKMCGNTRLIGKLHGFKRFRFMAGCHVEKLYGDEYLAGIEVIDLANRESRLLKVDALFVYRGIVPDIRIIGAQQDAKGFFVVDENFMTTLPGVFATGRVVYADLPVQILVGDGSRASLSAVAWLQAAG
jgi:thioredoxin reductase (NADPH)